MKVYGGLNAYAEIKAGSDKVLSFSAKASGTIIRAEGNAKASASGITKGIKLSGGQIDVNVVARVKGQKKWELTYTVYEGWSS